MATGAEIMNRAAILLQDLDHVRWPLSELCDWINEAMLAIVLAKPSACSETRVLHLVKGTLQKLPEAPAPRPLALIDLIRNIVEETPVLRGGRTITPVSRKVLDAADPSWHDPSRTRYARAVRHLIFDEAVPTQFYCYPGNDGAGMVEAALSVEPARLAATGDPDLLSSYEAPLTLPEPYSVPITDYVCYRAQSKDDTGAAPGRAAVHYQSFAAAIGLKVQVEGAASPNARRLPA